MGRILLALAAIGCVLLLITLVALEGGEVVVLRTTGNDGKVTETRLWIADEGGSAWIEAANEGRPFYRDILQRPDVELVRGGKVERFHAEPITTADGHPKIRRLLSEKYGWADWWIGLIADTSDSIAIRLARPRIAGLSMTFRNVLRVRGPTVTRRVAGRSVHTRGTPGTHQARPNG